MLYWIGSALFFSLVSITLAPGLFTEGEWLPFFVFASITAICTFVATYKYKRRKQAKELGKRSQAQFVEQKKEIDAGNLPVLNVDMRLYAGEQVHWCGSAELMETKTLGYSAGTAGVSVRVASGLVVRTGGIKGGAIKDLVSVASGNLAATSRRLVFTGDLKSFDVQLSKVNHIEKMTDGLVIHADGRARILSISEPSGNVMTGHAIMDKLLQNTPLQ